LEAVKACEMPERRAAVAAPAPARGLRAAGPLAWGAGRRLAWAGLIAAGLWVGVLWALA